MVDFTPIIELRGQRLARAQHDLARKRRAVTEAGQRLVEAQQDAAAFLQQTRTLESELLMRVLNKSVTTNDLLSIDEKLRKTTQRARQLARIVAMARQVLKDTSNAFEAASAEKRAREARLNKSRELHDQLQQIERLRLIAAENAELDEFSQLFAVARQLA